MQISARQLSSLLNGTIEGDPDVKINGPSKIEEGTQGTISFLSNPKYEQFAYTTNASALLVSNTFNPDQPVNATLIRVDNVMESVALLLDTFGDMMDVPKGISSNSSIHDSSKIGENVAIGEFTIVSSNVTINESTTIFPQVFVGTNVEIGKNVVIYPGVKIYHDCVIGDNSIIHANAVIGSDGFGFAPTSDGTYKKINHIGRVILEKNVEIGANTTIDRATMGQTIIREGVKLDNLVHIGHNVSVGENTVIAAQTGIAGSTSIGRNVLIGGQVGIVGHLSIADGSKFQAKSGVSKSVKEPNREFGGAPFLPYNQYMRSSIHIKNLNNMAEKVRELERKIEELSRPK